MATRNEQYWLDRFAMLEEARHRLSGRYYFEAEKLFDKAEKELEEKISVWYQRFMTNNGVNNLQQARMLLNSKQLEELQWDIDEYIKYGRENALNQKWIKELENASCKFHITRLEAIKLQLGQVCESLYKKFHDRTEESVKDVFRTNYYKTAYELQRGFEVGFDLNKVDDSMIEKIISKPWAADGKTFSERIWRDKDRLINELHNEMTVNIMTGANPKKLVDSIAKKFNTKKYNAGRLIATEGAFWSSASQKDCFNDLGVEKYKVIATLDEKTSETCQQLDGQVFFMKDFQPGVTAPPFHVNCRSTTAPYFDENFGEIGKRAARDEKGKTYYVPEDMTYPEWKKVFIDKEVKYEDWYKKHEYEKTNEIFIHRADTVKQAEEQAKKFSEVVSYEGITNLDSLNEANATYDRLFTKYPVKKLGRIVVKSDPIHLASSFYKELSPKIEFMNNPVDISRKNKSEFYVNLHKTRLQNLQKDLEDAKNGIFTKHTQEFIERKNKEILKIQNLLKHSRFSVIYDGREVQSVITHEFGHIIADQIFGQTNQERANPRFAKSDTNDLWRLCQKVKAVYKKTVENGDIFKISEYASKNEYEFFADSFVIYDMKIEKLPDYIENLFEEIIRYGLRKIS